MDRREKAGIFLIVALVVGVMLASVAQAVIPAIRVSGVQLSGQATTPIAATKMGFWIDSLSRARFDNGTSSLFLPPTTVAPYIPGTPTCMVGTGGGASGTCLIAAGSTDIRGTVTVTTNVLDTPSASADIVTVTFGTAYASAPVVLMGSSNDATFALAFGVSRIRASDTTTALFKVRSGTVPLPPLTAATYSWSWHSAP